MSQIWATVSDMAAVLASVIAVLGTLGGTITGYIFQRRITERNEITSREERLRQERLIACSAFAGAVVEFRRVQYDRWYRLRENPQGIVPADVRTESYRLRSAAWSSFCRFRLTNTDGELARLGSEAVEAAANITHTTDETEMRECGEHARILLEEFVIAAARQFEGGMDLSAWSEAATGGGNAAQPLTSKEPPQPPGNFTLMHDDPARVYSSTAYRVERYGAGPQPYWHA
jgi:hypothetical protein